MSIGYSLKSSIRHQVYRGRNVPWLLGAQSKNEDGRIAASCRTLKACGTAPYLHHKKAGRIKGKQDIMKMRKGGMTDAQIAKSMNISEIWVKKLWFRYVNRTGTIT